MGNTHKASKPTREDAWAIAYLVCVLIVRLTEDRRA